jgi:hypothetical protein
MEPKKLTAARYVKLKGVHSIKALTDFMGCSRWAIIYRFENDRELLDSDIVRYLETKKAG